MKKKDNGLSKITGKNKNNYNIILFVICLFITLYVILRISYVLNFESYNSISVYSKIVDKIFNPFPFIITFNYYSLLVLLFWMLILALKLKEDATPKPDSQWKDIEHGSNHFYSKDEMRDFADKKTDKIVQFLPYEIAEIENFKG